jgi:hypothetical protein
VKCKGDWLVNVWAVIACSHEGGDEYSAGAGVASLIWTRKIEPVRYSVSAFFG